MKKQKKVVFLGGCFQAEFSMRVSLMANGVECHYLYEQNHHSYLTSNIILCNYNIKDVIEITNNLEKTLIEIAPDIIIHRFYKNDAVMHKNAYDIAKKLGIPYGKYLMETDIFDNNDISERFNKCDFILYAHDTDSIKKVCDNELYKNNTFFYPYGVGVNEFSNKNIRKLNIVAFGYPRFGIPETEDREKNLKMIIDGVKGVGLKLNVFNSQSTDWKCTRFKNDVIINDFFCLEQENQVMNKFKIALNFESVHKMEGAYSHKMFQAMGRGIPTITFRKKCLENMFGFSGENLIFFESSDEVKYWIYFLLKNDKFRHELENRCEKYIHENYDWYKRFYNIMVKLNIWHE